MGEHSIRRVDARAPTETGLECGRSIDGWTSFPVKARYELGEERRGIFAVTTHNSVAQSSLSETERGGRKEKAVVGAETHFKPWAQLGRLVTASVAYSVHVTEP